MQPNNQDPNNPYYPPNPQTPQAGTVPIVAQPISGSSYEAQKPLGWIIGVILLTIALLAAIGAGYWAFSERQDYKNNVEKHVSVAVAEAEKKTTEKNNLKFAEELKNPLKNYVGPASYGSISVDYPKTWSAYVGNGVSSSSQFNAYFHPNVVPNVVAKTGEKEAVALHIEVLNQPYDRTMTIRESAIKSGKVSAAPYALPKNPNDVGVMFTGELASKLQGREILLPLRDKTIVITIETDAYTADINNYILPNLTFVP